MSTREIEEIESILNDLYESRESEKDLCASLSIETGNEWIQLTRDVLNIYWPFDDVEAKKLEKALNDVLPKCQLVEMDAGTFLMFEIELLHKKYMARLIDWIFTKVYGLQDTYQIDAKTFEI